MVTICSSLAAQVGKNFVIAMQYNVYLNDNLVDKTNKKFANIF
jgi:hypothetical protein